MTTQPATCPLCEATCGILVTHDGVRASRVVGDPDDPFSKGHLCPKALGLMDLHDDPDRLRSPVKRVGADFVPLNWDEAFAEVGSRIRSLQQSHGADGLAVYLGNPNVHNLGSLLHGPDLLRALGTRQRYSATSVDQLPHMVVANQVFGHQLLMAVPDVDRTDLLLIVGGNPVVSNGSILTAPGIERRLRALQARGGRVVVVDPRRTETAALADEHLFIRPGTDALFLAAMLHTLFAEGRVDPGRLALFVDGLETVEAAVRPFSPEAVSPRTGVSAEALRDLARSLAEAPRAVAYGRMGVSTQGFGTLCQWFLTLLNLATGNLDTEGGAMFTTPAVDPLGAVKLAGRGGLGRSHTRVRGLPEANGEFPVAALAEEIATPGPGQVRGLLTVAGNPVLSTPNGRALEAALSSLELLVCVDPYLNETTAHADYILPPVSPLQRPHYDVVFNLLACRNVAKWSPAVLPKAHDELDDGEILSRLHEAIAPTRRARLQVRAKRVMGPARLVDMALRAGPYGAGARLWSAGLTLAALRQHPHGLDLGPLESRLPARLQTSDQRIHAAPPVFVADVARLEAFLQEATDDEQLVLIGRRQLRSNNSWMHNAARLMKGRDRCTLRVHPNDAGRLGLVDGGSARIESAVGRVEAPVEVTDEVMPGVVSLPHGFGHGRPGTRQAVAARKPGVSLNDLTNSAVVDPVSGNAVLSGVPVTVTPASS